MNPWFSALAVAVLFLFMTQVTRQNMEELEPSLYHYVIENFEDDCGTTNAVTAILLDYRMYDTMFEVLILLTAIIGMKQFLPARHEFDRAAGRGDAGASGANPQSVGDGT